VATLEDRGRGERQPEATVAPSLRSLAVRGSLWTLGGYGLSQVLRLASNLVLTRLLMPEAFGLMALVNVVLQGLEMLSDVGVASAVVRDERGEDPEFLHTAWTLQVARGLLLTAAGILLAAPLAALYAEPMLTPLIQVACPSAALRGFTSANLFTQRRRMAFDRLAKIDLAERLVGIVVMLAWAAVAQSVWALIAGGIAGNVLRLALSHLYLEGPVSRLEWHHPSARTLFSFGKWVFLGSGLYFATQQADRLLLGRLVDIHMLGIYSVAVLLAEAGRDGMNRLIRQVLFPAYGRIFRESPARLADIYYTTRLRLDPGLVLPGIALMAAAPWVVQLLYDPRYYGAGWMLQILCVRLALSAIIVNGEVCLVAMGFPRYAMQTHLGRFAWIVVALPAGWQLAGMRGLVWATVLSELPALVIIGAALRRHGVLRIRRELPALALIAVAAIALARAG